MLLRFLFLILLLVHASLVCAENPLTKLENLQQSSLLVINQQDRIIYAKNPEQLYIPASTVKIITALIAMEYWGGNHYFSTHFYLDKQSNVLWIKGLGDPFLISEELDLVVQELKALGLKSVNGIGVDETYFAKDIYFHGRGQSNNPYDAHANALAVNFNTIQVQINNGVVMPGEEQTPITPIAIKLSKGLPEGKHRINLLDPNRSANYFVEVFTEKLVEAGIQVGNFRADLNPKEAELFLDYKNSRSVSEVISAMLLHSNNFIANQLYLMLGAEKFGSPANLNKSQRVMDDFVRENFSWNDYVLVDGSGLSRKNRLSAQQLVDVLQAFQRYRSLLPKQNAKIFAKSGTLKNVSTYAGFLQRDQSWWMFAIMINQSVDYKFRERLAEQLLNY